MDPASQLKEYFVNLKIIYNVVALLPATLLCLINKILPVIFSDFQFSSFSTQPADSDEKILISCQSSDFYWIRGFWIQVRIGGTEIMFRSKELIEQVRARWATVCLYI